MDGTKDAEVVCRMLGYPGVQTYKTTNFTPVKGIIWMQSSRLVLVQRRRLLTAVIMDGDGHTVSIVQDVGVTCKPGKL